MQPEDNQENDDPTLGEVLRRDGKMMGYVRAGSYGHTLGGAVGLVMLEAGEPIDAAYASDLSSILKGEHAPDIWIHGHVHASRDYRVGRTRVLANPRGHDTSHRRRNGDWIVELENPSFDPALVLAL